MTSSRLSNHCRAFLRGASREEDASLRAHVEACDFCRDWRQRRVRLTELLMLPVEPPAELRSRAMFDSIRERIVLACEESPLGRALDQVMPVASKPQAEDWPELTLDQELASKIRRVPLAAPEWSEVRESVFGGGVARQRVARARLLAGVGIAAAAGLCLLLFTGRDRTPQPEIVFTDVSSLSGFGFSPMDVLRNGGRQ